jgi:transposase
MPRAEREDVNKKQASKRLTSKERAEIVALRRKGLRIGEITHKVGANRNTVAKWILKAGLPIGWLPDPEKEILAMLRKNMDREDVATKLHCSLRAVKRVGLKYHTNKKPDPFHGRRARVDAAIKQRLAQAIDIARENHVGYRLVLRRAHEIFGLAKFIGGKQKVAFISYFPQSQKELTNFFDSHKLSVFPLDGPVKVLGSENALSLADLVVRTSFGGRVPDDFILFAEKLAHSYLRMILEEKADWWNGLSTPDKNLFGHALCIELIEAINVLRLMPESNVMVN